MRILFLAAADSIHSYRWVKHFADRNHEVHWISLVPHTVGEPLPGVHFHCIGHRLPKPLAVLKAAAAVRRLLKSMPFDVVHAHYAGTYGLAAALGAGPGFVLTAWGSDVLFARSSPIKRPFLKLVLSRASVITCDAQHMVDAMHELGASREKIHIILFGTDTKRFRPLGRDSDALAQWARPGDRVVVSLRSLYPVYDIPTLIRAVPLIAQRVPAAKVLVVGSGTERPALEALVQELGVAAHVVFCGPIPNPTLPAVLSLADVYVSTSLSDAGLAASTAEAMACGVPVVISDGPQNREWVRDGVQGYVVPPGDHAAFAHRVISLLEDPERAKEMGANGRREIDTRCNYHREMAKVERLYERHVELATARLATS